MARKSYPKRRLYGRRSNKALNKSSQEAIDNILPRLSIDAKEGSKSLSLSELFKNPDNPLTFEIGFGDGEHLLELINNNKDTNFIGAEPFINGMAALLKDLPENRLDDVRVLMGDAIFVADALPDHSVDNIYVLNPDPWPKTRHHKRRIINQENLTKFARILKQGGYLIMTTDVADLAEWMVTEASNHGCYEWTAESHKDWTVPPKDWHPTRYEKKGIAAGRQQVYMIFKRL